MAAKKFAERAMPLVFYVLIGDAETLTLVGEGNRSEGLRVVLQAWRSAQPGYLGSGVPPEKAAKGPTLAQRQARAEEMEAAGAPCQFPEEGPNEFALRRKAWADEPQGQWRYVEEGS